MQITNVRIETRGGQSKVIGTVNGVEKTVVQFFCDELWFSAKEFEGLTEAQAEALHRRRDVAYLRS